MFRFTIRELLILTLSAGLAVGWWLDRQSLNVWHVNRLEEFVAELGEAGLWVQKGDDGRYHLSVARQVTTEYFHTPPPLR
jgi:hypothetical protein